MSARQPGFRAVILAAGLGLRLRPLTQHLPKPLMPVVGKPVIVHSLEALSRAGCESVAINLFHQGDKIAARLGSRYADMEIVYSPEAELLGTLGALAPLTEFTRSKNHLVVVNGDSLCRWPLRKVLRVHDRSAAAVTLLVSTRAPLAAFGGGIGLDATGGVVSFSPQRSFGQVHKRAVFAGLHVLDTSALPELEPRPLDFVRDLYVPMLDGGEKIAAVETAQPWFDLGTPSGYLVGACDWAQRRGPAKVARRSWVAPDAVVDPTATVRRSVVEAGSRIGPGAEVVHSLILPGARVGDGATVRDSLVGFRVRLPAATVVERRLVTEARADAVRRAGDSVVGGLVYSPLG